MIRKMNTLGTTCLFMATVSSLIQSGASRSLLAAESDLTIDVFYRDQSGGAQAVSVPRDGTVGDIERAITQRDGRPVQVIWDGVALDDTTALSEAGIGPEAMVQILPLSVDIQCLFQMLEDSLPACLHPNDRQL